MHTLRSHSLKIAVSLAAAATLFAGQAMAAPVKLTGDQEVPANTSAAIGTGDITVADDGSVSGSVTAASIQGTVAHIHAGAVGVNGPVIIPLTGSAGGVWTVPAGAKLTPEQLATYKAGNLYVNVHTAEHKGGEIRTQLKP